MTTFAMESPKGTRIVASSDSILANAAIQGFYEHDGQVIPEYVGETEVYWDSQETKVACDEPIFVDENGREWLARECRPVWEDDTPWETVAAVEGWGFFNDCEVQRIDEVDRFEGDLHALMHIISEAARDETGPHYRFLVWWRDNFGESYRSTMEDVVRNLPDVDGLDQLGTELPTPWFTCIFAMDRGDDGDPHMFCEAVQAPDPVAAVETLRDLHDEDGGFGDAIRDIITIPGKHDAVGPSEPWWRS